MKTGWRRIRGTLGTGLTWAAAWSGVGFLVTLGFLLATGRRPDAPFPVVFGVFGFGVGVLFSAVLGLAERRRSLDRMSIPRFSAWGAIAGASLSAIFVLAVSLAGDPSFLGNLGVVSPLFAAVGALSAAGSLALARKAHDRALPGASRDPIAVGATAGESRKGPRNGR